MILSVGLVAWSLFTGISGGRIADRASRRSAAGRVYVGAFALLLAAPLTLGALLLGEEQVALFVIVFSVGWLLQYAYYTAAYPAIADVVGPRLRGTAVSIYLAASCLLGGAVGPVLAGALSDRFAAAATDLTASEAAAYGLRLSLTIVIPASLLLAAAGLLGAARHVIRDQARMHAASWDPERRPPVSHPAETAPFCRSGIGPATEDCTASSVCRVGDVP